jgi:hypothetical protein
MSIDDVKDYYKEIISNRQTGLSGIKKTIFRVGTLRLAISVIAVVGAYVWWGNTFVVVTLLAICIVLFLVLVKYHSALFGKKRYNERQIINAQNELKAFGYDFSAFDGASEKIDAKHSFSFDLDLFGERSLFQSINRTVTSFGKEALAGMLTCPLNDKPLILDRQQAIEELKQKQRLIAHYRAIGQMDMDEALNINNFRQPLDSQFFLDGSRFWPMLLWLVPSAYIVLVILVCMGWIPAGIFVLLYIITFALSGIPHKRIGKIIRIFEAQAKTLDTYCKLFTIVEGEAFSSPLLQQLQQQLIASRKASETIGQLKSLLGSLFLSSTFPLQLFLNPLLLWNVRYAIRIGKWLRANYEHIERWFAALAQFDALASWSIFAFNHPGYVYPEIKDRFVFEGKGLGHPLLNRDVCVRNDVNVSQSPQFLVVTGANMAGKSTYLRTIGINHVLACIGAPVCATSLSFYPCNLVTNLRTADSLADNESYFFAELKRLKMIIDRLNSGEQLFVILDEILKGTNSVDKQKGSLALMKQLLSLGTYGIIATHDLLLGNLEKEYPDRIKNYCFEADIEGDKLLFTYKLQQGVAQNMNATFLMKRMGITVGE